MGITDAMPDEVLQRAESRAPLRVSERGAPPSPRRISVPAWFACEGVEDLLQDRIGWSRALECRGVVRGTIRCFKNDYA